MHNNTVGAFGKQGEGAMLKRLFTVAVLAVPLVVLSCSDDSVAPTGTTGQPQIQASAQAAQSVDLEQYFLDQMDDVNAGFEAEGLGYRVAVAEVLTNGDGEQAGITVIAKNIGNKQLAHDFVPFDPRREGTPITNGGWSGSIAGPNDDITYAVDMTADAVPPNGGLTAAQTDAAIDRAMATWDALNCSDLPITQNPDFGVDIGFIRFYDFDPPLTSPPSTDGGPFILADVQHAGWGDIDFPGGVLGATYTLVFFPVTDIDNNGKADTAFREIYYDPTWDWFDDGVTNFDVESVAVHEMGHGLSQAHFGQVFFKKDGSIKRSPFALMNAIYTQPLQTLQVSDNGGHCSNWGQWPHN